MIDMRLENRKKQSKFNEFNTIQSLEQTSLKLRKQKMEGYFTKKRLNSLKVNTEEDKSNFEVIPELLSIPESHIIKIVSLQDSIDRLYQYLTSNNNDYIKAALYSLREYFVGSPENNSIEILSSYKIIENFTFLLVTTTDDQIIFEILWSMINISSCINNLSPLYQSFNDAKVIDVLMKCVNSDYTDIAENSLWALKCICIHSKEFCQIIINHPIYQLILSFFHKDKIDVFFIKLGIEFLGECIKELDFKLNEKIIKESLKILSDIFYIKDFTNSTILALSLIAKMSDPSNYIASFLIDEGIILKLLKMNYVSNVNVLQQALMIIAYSLYNNDTKITAVMDMNLLDFYDNILEMYPNNKYFANCIAGGLINISGGKIEIRLRLINSHLFIKVIEFLDKDYKLLRENTKKIFKNLVIRKNEEIANKLYDLGVIQKIINIAMTQTPQADIDYIKILYHYLYAIKKNKDNQKYYIIYEQFFPFLENNNQSCNYDIDSLVKSLNDNDNKDIFS